jgi:hypothetical protein
MGFARRLTHAIGIARALFARSAAGGFGRPYVPSTTTDVGAAIIYSLVFWALLLVDAGRTIVDRPIAARIPNLPPAGLRHSRIRSQVPEPE